MIPALDTRPRSLEEIRDELLVNLNPCRRPAQCTDAGFGPASCTLCNPRLAAVEAEIAARRKP